MSGLYVTLTRRGATEPDREILDAAAVVAIAGGYVRICCDGKPDEEVRTAEWQVCVVPA